MARKALAAVSIALLSLGAASAAQAQTSATVVIQTGTPFYQQPAPVRVQYQAPPPPRYEVAPPPAAAWRGCPVTGNGVATAMCGCRATGLRLAPATTTASPVG